MQRYFFEISYDGTDYYGWQIQPEQITVQEEIEKCLKRLNSNNYVKTMGCGRTDTGVHAINFIFHADLEETFPFKDLVYKMNKMLPNSIAVHRYFPVDNEKHARFSATSRTYHYFVHLKKDPFKSKNSLFVNGNLDFDLMNEAGKLLLGTQDFTSLSKLHTSVKTNICTVSKAEWIKISDSEFYFEITANRFLRNMVRATVGTLLDVGKGIIIPENVVEILEAKDRREASISVPAHGLFLRDIVY